MAHRRKGMIEGAVRGAAAGLALAMTAPVPHAAGAPGFSAVLCAGGETRSVRLAIGPDGAVMIAQDSDDPRKAPDDEKPISAACHGPCLCGRKRAAPTGPTRV